MIFEEQLDFLLEIFKPSFASPAQDSVIGSPINILN